MFTHPHDQVRHDDLVALGFAPHDVQAAKAKFSWTQMLQLLQFLGTYGPKLFTIAAAVAAVVQAPGGVTITTLVGLVQQYGPDVLKMVTLIAGWFGVALPALPTP